MVSLKSLLILIIAIIFIFGVTCYTLGYVNGFGDTNKKIKSRFDYKSTLKYPHIVCNTKSPSVCEAIVPPEFQDDKYKWSIERWLESDLCYDVLVAKNNINETIVWDFQECWERGF